MLLLTYCPQTRDLDTFRRALFRDPLEEAVRLTLPELGLASEAFHSTAAIARVARRVRFFTAEIPVDDGLSRPYVKVRQAWGR